MQAEIKKDTVSYDIDEDTNDETVEVYVLSLTGRGQGHQYTFWGFETQIPEAMRGRIYKKTDRYGEEELTYALQDAHFHITTLADTTGAAVERCSYTPYGEQTILDADFTIDSGGSDYNWTHGHQGLMHDPETGLIQNRYRIRHALLGRWLHREPLGYVDGMSLYQYVRSQPLYFVDPTGLEAEVIDEAYYGGTGELYVPEGWWEEANALDEMVEWVQPDKFPDPDSNNKWSREYRENFAHYVKDIYATYQDIFQGQDGCCVLDPCTLAAQWMGESSWGTSGLSKDAYNFGGIKGEGPAGHYDSETGEHFDGQDVTIVDEFRAYNNILEFMDDYTRLICKYDIYEDARGKSGEEYYSAIKSAGYATDPSYVDKNMQLYNQLGCGQ